MKKYVILAFAIAGIGGEQIYSRNKKLFLQDNGWSVLIFSSWEDRVCIDELVEFQNTIVPELRFPPNFFSRKKREIIIESVVGKIVEKSSLDEVVVESHTENHSLWGELIAKRLSAKHVVYLLNETFSVFSKEMYEFLDFKHRRRELAGISAESMGLLFRGHKELATNENYFLKAACTNVVEEVSNPIIDSIARTDINIGSIGRLQKAYFGSLISGAISFAQKNQYKIIQLIVVGGSPDGKLERTIWRKVRDISNLKLIITGRLYPIPRKLFSLVDIFVSGAGSARVSAAEGVLTMTVDVNTGKPIGLLGYDTNNSIYGDKEQTKSIAEMLQEVLLEKEMHKKKIPMKYEQTIPDFRQRYAEHMDFIERSEQEKEYYPIDKIKLVDKRGSIKKLLFKTLGRNGYEKVVSMYARLKAKKRY